MRDSPSKESTYTYDSKAEPRNLHIEGIVISAPHRAHEYTILTNSNARHVSLPFILVTC